jgi:hypothetical protein
MVSIRSSSSPASFWPHQHRLPLAASFFESLLLSFSVLLLPFSFLLCVLSPSASMGRLDVSLLLQHPIVCLCHPTEPHMPYVCHPTWNTIRPSTLTDSAANLSFSANFCLSVIFFLAGAAAVTADAFGFSSSEASQSSYGYCQSHLFTKDRPVGKRPSRVVDTTQSIRHPPLNPTCPRLRTFWLLAWAVPGRGQVPKWR